MPDYMNSVDGSREILDRWFDSELENFKGDLSYMHDAFGIPEEDDSFEIGFGRLASLLQLQVAYFYRTKVDPTPRLWEEFSLEFGEAPDWLRLVPPYTPRTVGYVPVVANLNRRDAEAMAFQIMKEIYSG